MKGKLTKLIMLLASLSMATACGTVVVKVEKKSKSAKLASATSNAKASLSGTAEFLDHLDSLKVIAIDLLMEELSDGSFRKNIRNSIRQYRSFLIERSAKDYKLSDPFYSSADQCRSAPSALNLDEANDFLGMILKTAVLAKIGEVNAPKINPGLSKEIGAIAQIILMELGIKVEGVVSADDQDGNLNTSGQFALSLAPIDNEGISAEEKLRDQVEVLTISFNRNHNSNYEGDFSATIGLAHSVNGEVKQIEANMKLSRTGSADAYSHSIEFSLGNNGEDPRYQRVLTAVPSDEKNKLDVTDMMSTNGDSVQFKSIIDLDAKTQCKETGVTDDDDHSSNDDDSGSDHGDHHDSDNGHEHHGDNNGDGDDTPIKGDDGDDSEEEGDGPAQNDGPTQNGGPAQNQDDSGSDYKTVESDDGQAKEPAPTNSDGAAQS